MIVMLSKHVTAAFLLLLGASYAQEQEQEASTTINSTQPVVGGYWKLSITTEAQAEISPVMGPEGCSATILGYFAEGGIEMEVFSNFPSDLDECYNLADIAELGGDPGALPRDTVNVNDWLKLTSTRYYNSSAEYTRVGYSIGTYGGNWTQGRLLFQTFELEDCARDGTEEEAGFTQWSCNTFVGDCAELSYGIRSFRLSENPESNQTQCTVAGGENAGSRQAASGLAIAAVVVAAGVAIVL